jgi:hypothetical protein
MGDLQGHHGAADLLGDGAGIVAAYLGQDQRKFLAAIAAGEVERALSVAADDARDRAKTLVAGLVAVLVIEQLEMIDVDEQQR